MDDSIIQKRLEIGNSLVYLKLMSALVRGINFHETNATIVETRRFLDTASPEELSEKIDFIKESIEKLILPIQQRFPPKVAISQIAAEFNNAFLKDEELFETGLTLGFLDKLMNLSYFNWYPDMPYHYRITIGVHKGNGGIEEDFLLKDAFVFYAKAQRAYTQVVTHFAQLEKQGMNVNHPEFKSAYAGLTDLKYEVATYCRLTVVSFFSFIESFVNSIGHDFVLRHRATLTEKEILTLRGLHKDRPGSYLSLKQKIEKIHQVIRSDKLLVISLSDTAQHKEPFKTFFAYYEALRNASVHFSPEKEKIWLGPDEWVAKTNEFCELALEVGLAIWIACYPETDGPAYLGKLAKAKHLMIAEKRLANIAKLL